MKQLLSLGAVIAVLVGLFSGANAQATVKVEDLPREITDQANRGYMKASELISDSIFDQLGHIDIFKTDLAATGSVGIRIGRKVYNNFDLEESFTVVDQMSLPISLPTFSIPMGVTGLSFNIGANGGLNFTNLRIIRARDRTLTETMLTQILSKKDLNKRAAILDNSGLVEQATEGFKEADLTGSKALDAASPDKKDVTLFDALRRSRYGDLWKMVAVPLRLPLRASWLGHLSEREVITYGGTGQIEVGPTFGVSASLPGVAGSVNAGINVRAYLTGDFRIAVMKLGAKRAKVKVMRSHAYGIRDSVGSGASAQVYEGYLLSTSLLGQKISTTVGKLKESVIPFSIGADRSWGKSFQAGFEYDLNTPEGVEAYEQAVIGRFALSQELAQAGSSSVKQLFQETADTHTSIRNLKLDLTLISHEGSATYTVENATIEFPDGTYEVYQARTDLTFKSSLGIWPLKNRESVSYVIQPQSFLFNKSLRLELFAEGTIEDNYTSGDELNNYSSRVEKLFGSSEIFPKVPTEIVDVDAKPEIDFNACSDRGECDPKVPPPLTAYYGRSYIHFRLGLNEEQLRKFLLTPETEMWSQLEVGFGRAPGFWANGHSGRVVSAIFGVFFNFFEWFFQSGDITQRLGAKYLHATSFRSNWINTQQILKRFLVSPELDLDQAEKNKLAEALGEMYSDKVFAYELMLTTLSTLRTAGIKDISYSIVAQSSAFPPVSLKGADLTEVEKLQRRLADETNFEKPQVQHDAKLEVSDLHVVQTGAGQFKVEFKSAVEPSHVFIRLNEVSRWFLNETPVFRQTVLNQGKFTQGMNEILIAPDKDATLESNLASVIEPNTNYRLTIGLYTENGQVSGAAKTVEFFSNPWDKIAEK